MSDRRDVDARTITPGREDAQLTLEEAGREGGAFLLDPHEPPEPVSAPGPNTVPRLRRLWMSNFKGFETFEIELGEFNVLAGPNNVGKSTILQAADLVFRLLDLHREGQHRVAEGRNVPPALLPVAQLRDLWYGQRYRVQNTFVKATVGAEFTDGAVLEFGIIGPFASANSRITQLDGLTEERLDELVGRPAVWVPSSVGVVRDEEYRTPARRAGLIDAGRHNEVLRNQLLELSNSEEAFRELQQILERHFGGSLASVTFDELVDQFVSAQYTQGGVRHDLYSVGSGFLQVVQLLAFILLKTPSLLLLDEPDAHLHSSLQKTVIDVLDGLSNERNMQIVLSTHSKEIINYVDASRLILVEKGAVAAAPLGPAVTQLTVLQSLGAVDNVDAYALFRNRRCLFVEGPTDETVLRRFAAALGAEPFSGDDRVVVIPTKGADRFEHVDQLTVIESLLGGTVTSYEVRDRDGRTDAHRDAVMAGAARPLHVLERDCLESYLVEPSVIARVVNDVSAEAGSASTVDAEDVERIALEETERLRDSAVDRVADRYSREEHRLNRQYPPLPRANEVARAFVNDNWDGLRSRLRVVPGKELLARIRQRLQDTYGVSFGDKRLAEAFSTTEIPQEIQEIVNAIRGIATAHSDAG